MMKFGLALLAAYGFVAAGAAQDKNLRRGLISEDGFRVVGMTMDNDWRITGLERSSEWAGTLEVDDVILAYGTSSRNHFKLKENSDRDDFAEFLCDNDGRSVYLWVKNHRDDEGYVVRVDVEDDYDDC